MQLPLRPHTSTSSRCPISSSRQSPIPASTSLQSLASEATVVHLLCGGRRSPHGSFNIRDAWSTGEGSPSEVEDGPSSSDDSYTTALFRKDNPFQISSQHEYLNKRSWTPASRSRSGTPATPRTPSRHSTSPPPSPRCPSTLSRQAAGHTQRTETSRMTNSNILHPGMPASRWSSDYQHSRSTFVPMQSPAELLSLKSRHITTLVVGLHASTEATKREKERTAELETAPEIGRREAQDFRNQLSAQQDLSKRIIDQLVASKIKHKDAERRATVSEAKLDRLRLATERDQLRMGESGGSRFWGLVTGR